MADNKLKDFYKCIAFGEFDRALELGKKLEPFGDEKEKIVLQSLRIKKILQNFDCLKGV